MKRTLRVLTLVLGLTLYLGGLSLLTGGLTTPIGLIGGTSSLLFGSAFVTAALV